MPNWCRTTIRIRAGIEAINKLEAEIAQATAINPCKANYGSHGEKWLGNLLLHIGVPEEEVLHEASNCNGTLEIVNRLADEELFLATVTAWTPMMRCIERFVKHYAADAAITYCLQESGCGTYWTNDPETADTVDGEWSYDILPDMDELLQAVCGNPLASVMEELKDYYGQECSTLSEYAHLLAQQTGKDDYAILLWVYKYVPIEETE